MMLLNCGIGEDSWESLGLQGEPTSPSERISVLSIHWKDWYWNWSSNTLATWCEELTHWKRPWCWERLKVGGEGDDRGWDSWMSSPTQLTWVWVNSRSWWWTRRPCKLQSWTRHSVAELDTTEWLDWTELIDELLFSHSVCPPLCDPMGWCMPGSPILHHLPKLTQTPIHWLSDAIEQSNPLSSPSPPAFNLSQHQDHLLMSWPLPQAAKVLELQLQHQSFQWIFRIDLFRIDWFDILSVKGTYKSQL